MVASLLDLSGIGRARMKLCWVSAAEGQLFAEYVTRFSDQIRELGPFDPETRVSELTGIEGALTAPRLR